MGRSGGLLCPRREAFISDKVPCPKEPESKTPNRSDLHSPPHPPKALMFLCLVSNLSTKRKLLNQTHMYVAPWACPYWPSINEPRVCFAGHIATSPKIRFGSKQRALFCAFKTEHSGGEEGQRYSAFWVCWKHWRGALCSYSSIQHLGHLVDAHGLELVEALVWNGERIFAAHLLAITSYCLIFAFRLAQVVLSLTHAPESW